MGKSELALAEGQRVVLNHDEVRMLHRLATTPPQLRETPMWTSDASHLIDILYSNVQGNLEKIWAENSIGKKGGE